MAIIFYFTKRELRSYTLGAALTQPERRYALGNFIFEESVSLTLPPASFARYVGVGVCKEPGGSVAGGANVPGESVVLAKEEPITSVVPLQTPTVPTPNEQKRKGGHHKTKHNALQHAFAKVRAKMDMVKSEKSEAGGAQPTAVKSPPPTPEPTPKKRGASPAGPAKAASKRQRGKSAPSLRAAPPPKAAADAAPTVQAPNPPPQAPPKAAGATASLATATIPPTGVTAAKAATATAAIPPIAKAAAAIPHMAKAATAIPPTGVPAAAKAAAPLTSLLPIPPGAVFSVPTSNELQLFHLHMKTAPPSVQAHWKAVSELPPRSQKNCYKRQCVSEFLAGGNTFGTKWFQNLKELYEEKLDEEEGSWISRHQLVQLEGEEGADEMIRLGLVDSRPHRYRPAPAQQFRYVVEKDITRTGTKHHMQQHSHATGDEEQHTMFDQGFTIAHQATVGAGGPKKRTQKDPIEKTDKQLLVQDINKTVRLVGATIAKATNHYDSCAGNPYVVKFEADFLSMVTQLSGLLQKLKEMLEYLEANDDITPCTGPLHMLHACGCCCCCCGVAA